MRTVAAIAGVLALLALGIGAVRSRSFDNLVHVEPTTTTVAP